MTVSYFLYRPAVQEVPVRTANEQPWITGHLTDVTRGKTSESSTTCSRTAHRNVVVVIRPSLQVSRLTYIVDCIHVKRPQTQRLKVQRLCLSAEV